MPTLLKIGSEMEAILARIGDDGELPPELDAWFDQLQSDLAGKADGYAALTSELTMRAAMRREEAERLAKRAQVDDNTARRLKDRLRDFMIHHGIPHIETERYRISVAKNGGALPVKITVTAEELPLSYQQQTVAADTLAIRAALLEGKSIPGAVLGERGTHLRIS